MLPIIIRDVVSRIRSDPTPGIAHHRYLRAYIRLFALALVLSGQALYAQTQSTAALTAPLNGATGVDPGTMFTWTPVNGATSYEVVIGTSAGASDVYDSGKIAGRSFPALTLLSDATYYVRLFTCTLGASSYSDSSFTTGTGRECCATPRMAQPALTALTCFLPGQAIR